MNDKERKAPVYLAIIAALILFTAAAGIPNVFPISVVSVQELGPPPSPGGPTIKVTLKANSTDAPITKLSATLTMETIGPFHLGNLTFDFPGINQSNPLMPDKTASQTLVFVNGYYNQSSTYPLLIEGTLQNGQTFSYMTPVMITKSTEPSVTFTPTPTVMPTVTPSAGGTVVSIANVTITQNSNITRSIIVENVTNLASGTIWLTYDPNMVNVLSVSSGDLDTVTTNIDNAIGKTTITSFSNTGRSGNVTFTNLLLKAVGQINASSPLTLSVQALTDPNGNSIPYTIRSGTFAVSATMKGDVNGDGLITVVDALFVSQYTVGLRTLTSSQLAAADVDGDGQVTVVDALFIAQYTVGLRQL